MIIELILFFHYLKMWKNSTLDLTRIQVISLHLFNSIFEYSNTKYSGKCVGSGVFNIVKRKRIFWLRGKRSTAYSKISVSTSCIDWLKKMRYPLDNWTMIINKMNGIPLESDSILIYKFIHLSTRMKKTLSSSKMLKLFKDSVAHNFLLFH